MNRIDVRLSAPTEEMIAQVQDLFNDVCELRTHVFMQSKIGEPEITVNFFREDLTKIVNPDIWTERARIQDDAFNRMVRLQAKAMALMTSPNVVPVEAVSGKRHASVDTTNWSITDLWAWVAQQQEDAKCDVIVRIVDGKPTFVLYDDWME
jgi:hypothetical protein